MQFSKPSLATPTVLATPPDAKVTAPAGINLITQAGFAAYNWSQVRWVGAFDMWLQLQMPCDASLLLRGDVRSVGLV